MGLPAVFIGAGRDKRGQTRDSRASHSQVLGVQPPVLLAQLSKAGGKQDRKGRGKKRSAVKGPGTREGPRGRGGGSPRGEGMTTSAWLCPRHTPQALPPQCPEPSALSKALRRVLSSVSGFCNTRHILSRLGLPNGFS